MTDVRSFVHPRSRARTLTEAQYEEVQRAYDEDIARIGTDKDRIVYFKRFNKHGVLEDTAVRYEDFCKMLAEQKARDMMYRMAYGLTHKHIRV